MDRPNHATIGCVFSTDADAIAALRALSEAELVTEWRVGAIDGDRAAKIAQTIGGKADLDTADPLSGVAGVASGTDAASGVNSGALIGAIAGAIGGFAIGATPLAAIVPVDQSMRSVAASLLFFAIGTAVGGVLGGALGTQSSTHAGFRLIDAMEAGDIAVTGTLEQEQIRDARRLLEKNGAAEIIVIAK